MEKQETTLELKDFEFDLPAELIAQEPLEKRDESRLFVIDRQDNSFKHVHFRDILEFLKPGDVIVANDTQVIPASSFRAEKRRQFEDAPA